MAVLNIRNLLIIAVVVLIVVVVLNLFVFLSVPKSFAGEIDSITLGVYPSEYSSLVYIAKDQQYFLANGLNVTFKDYPSGSTAVSGMLNGDVDVSTASEFVIVNHAMNNVSIVAFGSVSKYLNLYLVARSDRSIRGISDIEGKKIGVSIGTALQFYLGRFLELNGINESQVTIVNMNFADSANSLANGTVDALITFEPYIDQIENLLSSKVIEWPAQNNQFGYFEAICTKNWATTHSDIIVRFLKALLQAENFNINHQEQAIAMVAKDLNYTHEYTTSIWSDYQYSVTLDQSFVLLMQEEARWLISYDLTDVTSVPNFLTNIYADGLKSVEPQSVNIIGLGD